MSTLIVPLPPESPGPSTELGYVLTDDGYGAARTGQCTAALLPAPGRTGETVAVVPLSRLSWQRVTLPQGTLGQAQRLRTVLEGLLEEQLLDEPALLHFALQPEAATGTPIWVAVCERAWLQGALQALEAAGHRVARVVPAWAPGPTASGQMECTVVGEPEHAMAVLTGMGENLALGQLPLHAPALRSLLQPQTPLRAEPAVAELAERVLERSAALLPRAEALLAAARGSWNLAQFDLARNRRQRTRRWLGAGVSALLHARQWRAARWALVLLVALQLLALNLWAWQDARGLRQRQEATRKLLTQTFPQVKLVVDAPVQMQREVDELRRASGALAPGDFEALLAMAAAVLAPGQVPSGIDYGQGRLRLAGLSLSEEQLGAARQQLAAAGLQLGREDQALVLQLRGAP
ncbi:type II secretion system protein GspL [Comamonas flocculans]|uniref:General secretion pathway protein GspL n=1 Tax=Comamonas flocculans TaxID=2597701 RepID=A0A5B8RV21_9BURK|nr:type II secretion system protein GspL [Comamonas flocculans]QEA13371.1 general secretion pathway protein GspL [Comamonas flocculans]